MKLWDSISESIQSVTGKPFEIASQQSIGGGCINEAYKITGKTATGENDQAWFVKLNQTSGLKMFEAEHKGLQELSNTNTIRVPKPLCSGVAENKAYLVMEYIELTSRGADPAQLGQQLAAMHQVTTKQFGYVCDNTIGSTPQVNTPEKDWVGFWQRHRLGYQLQLAARKGGGGGLQRKGEQLMDQFSALFTDYRPKASLLHGDLWGGNCSSDCEGSPVIYDPAVYYGDHEADLAMTELFGGFGHTFYSAYADVFPIDAGYPVRKTLYNLYHILNHFNLFGGGYAAQAESMIDHLLVELS